MTDIIAIGRWNSMMREVPGAKPAASPTQTNAPRITTAIHAPTRYFQSAMPRDEVFLLTIPHKLEQHQRSGHRGDQIGGQHDEVRADLLRARAEKGADGAVDRRDQQRQQQREGQDDEERPTV